MTRHATIILFLFLCSLGSALADTHPAKANMESPQINSAKKAGTASVIDQSPTNRKGISDLEAYQLLYANSKEANANILTTLHFSLGIVATFFLALVGSQIFFNYRISKEEINSIRKDIDNKIALLSAKLIENIKDQSQIVEGAMNSKLEERSKLIDAKIEVQNKDIELLRSSLDEDIKEMAINLEETTGHIWNLRGVKANALTSFVRTASLEIEAGKLSVVKYALDHVIKTLKSLTEIHIADYLSLEKLVKIIPEKNSELGRIIVDLFQFKPVYEYIHIPDSDSPAIKKYVKNAPAAQ